MTHKTRTLQTIDRGLAVIELLSTAPNGLKLSEMARELGLKAQTLLGIVRSLQARKVVIQEETGGTYFLGPRVNIWQQRWLDNNGSAVSAREPVEALACEIRESVMLVELRGVDLVALVRADVKQEIMLTSPVDSGGAMHAMSTSKLLIAFLPDRQGERLIRSLKLNKLGPNTITRKRDFRAALTTIREKGFAVSDQERCEGVVSLAVPVKQPNGQVRAALGVSAPSLRTDPGRIEKILGASRKAAGKIEKIWYA